MATTFEFRVSCTIDQSDRADDALSVAHEKVAQLETELSVVLEASPVFQLNHARPFQKIPFTPAGIELLKESERIHALSGSAFNHLAKTRGETRNAVEFDEPTRMVWRTHSEVWLGFGAIGKGYALDWAAEIIENEKFRDYVLSAGGSSLLFSGFSAPDSAWSWGWSWKKNERGENLGIPLSHSSGKKIALGISGLHEKGNHIIASTASPTRRPRSALVSHASAASADALSTALFVAGWESGNDFLKNTQADGAALIDPEEIPHWNAGFQKLFGALASGLAGCAIFLYSSLHSSRAFADESVDLADLGANAFTPYVTERHEWWALLPVLALGLVVLHLMKNKTKKDLK
jgi:thiamine biosynthesis lipoprotein ApbE